MKLSRRDTVAAAVIGGLAMSVMTGGAAYAFWTTTGTGAGSSQAGTMQPVTVSAGTATGTALYPGLTANGSTTGGSLTMTASNPNAFPVTVTVTSTGASGCTAPATSIPSTLSATFTLPAESTGQTRTVHNVVSMGTDASNDCQGKVITLALATTSVSGP